MVVQISATSASGSLASSWRSRSNSGLLQREDEGRRLGRAVALTGARSGDVPQHVADTGPFGVLEVRHVPAAAGFAERLEKSLRRRRGPRARPPARWPSISRCLLSQSVTRDAWWCWRISGKRVLTVMASVSRESTELRGSCWKMRAPRLLSETLTRVAMLRERCAEVSSARHDVAEPSRRDCPFLAPCSLQRAVCPPPEGRRQYTESNLRARRPASRPRLISPAHSTMIAGGTPAGAALAAQITHARGGLMETADVVVIGGGVMGTSIAFNLARRRAGRVVLLEKNTVCSGHLREVLRDRAHPLHDAADGPDGTPRPRHLRAVGRGGGRGVRVRADRHAVHRAAREPGPGRADAPHEPGGRDRGEPDRARRRPPDQPAPPGPRRLGRGVRAPLGLRQPPRGRIQLRPPLHGARRRAAAVDPGHRDRYPGRAGPQRDHAPRRDRGRPRGDRGRPLGGPGRPAGRAWSCPSRPAANRS